jgi:hypothetical protein
MYSFNGYQDTQRQLDLMQFCRATMKHQKNTKHKKNNL